MRVLVVEDEKKTASFIRKALQAESFAVDVSHNGQEALTLAATTPFDAIILDIMLPGRDGLSVVRQLREQKNSTPVLLLSARGEVNERVEGLNAGADDYLPKPFALAELIARVRALGRRGNEPKSILLRIADLALDTVTHEARRGERRIELTAREYRLLEFLMRTPGRICGRMQILEKVWDYDFDPGTNLVDVYVKRLREKIDDGFAVKLLHTVRGVGYVMKEELPAKHAK
jgi:DNA-binding response OmpR family regulator